MGEEEGCGATRLVRGRRVWRHTPYMGEKGVAPLPMVSSRDLVQYQDICILPADWLEPVERAEWRMLIVSINRCSN